MVVYLFDKLMNDCMKIKDIILALEAELPLWLQESYDNCGLQVGDPDLEATGALLCVDLTEQVVEEAIERGCNLIVAHHPLLFKGLKTIGTGSYIERVVMRAIKADVAIYAAHTNADNAPVGLNALLARDLGLKNLRPLQPLSGKMSELITFVPQDYLEPVQEALWAAGAGRIGAYDKCSFSSSGQGTFRALEGANPFVGEQGELHHESEVRLSVVLASADSSAVIKALHEAHPYEVPAYSLVPLANDYPMAGSGIVGDLAEQELLSDFLDRVKAYFATEKLSYSACDASAHEVRRVAICSGAGAFLWRAARRASADVLITGEAKYNDYFDVECRPVLATVGHYESECIATRVFGEIISRKFPNFMLFTSQLNSNPIKSI